MKILFTIHSNFDPNAGAVGVTCQLGQAYQKFGHHVDYYSLDNLPKTFPKMGKDILFPEFVAHHIAKVYKPDRLDVIDASTGDGWLWSKIRQFSHQKSPLLVTRSHGIEHLAHQVRLESARLGDIRLSWKYSLYGGKFRLWEVATSMRHSDLVLCLNRAESKYIIEKLGIAPERVRIANQGIPDTFLNLPFEPISDTTNSKIGIAIIATYLPRKGTQYSVPALNNILRRYPQVQVSFLGTVSPETTVHADFDPNVRDRVRVIPHYTRETLPTLLKEHQIELLPSLSEGFPLSLLESMACGLVPISTFVPEAPDIFRDGHNSLSIPYRNSLAIEETLEKLIGDRPYLEKLRHNAYQTAQNYSWSSIARQTLSFYEEALSSRSSPYPTSSPLSHQDR